MLDLGHFDALTGSWLLPSLRGGPASLAPMALSDSVRQMQGRVLDWFGFGPDESPYDILHANPRWRVRKYAGGHGAPLLIVAAPIKRPYVWDLSPQVSTLKHCLLHHFCPYLLEWLEPALANDGDGLADYAGRSIGEAVARVSEDAGRANPFLIGHSLGGTLAAIYATSGSAGIRGLVLLAAPLCFAAGSSSFRDAVATLDAAFLPTTGIVPGSLLSQISAVASPEIFVWSRFVDGYLSANDREAYDTHVRVERWALDEVPLSARLMREVLRELYCENRLCRETLVIEGRALGPSRLGAPTLAVVNTADALAPRASMAPFLDAASNAHVSLIEHPGEVGVGFQHLAILIGRRAHAETWPEILAWLRVHE